MCDHQEYKAQRGSIATVLGLLGCRPPVVNASCEWPAVLRPTSSGALAQFALVRLLLLPAPSLCFPDPLSTSRRARGATRVLSRCCGRELCETRGGGHRVYTWHCKAHVHNILALFISHGTANCVALLCGTLPGQGILIHPNPYAQFQEGST
jgi:hypothetical protein